jgi:hypothetical protein
MDSIYGPEWRVEEKRRYNASSFVTYRKFVNGFIMFYESPIEYNAAPGRD